MNISAPFIHRPIATALLMVGLLVGGLVSYPLLPVAALPNVNYPTLQVTAQLPGADPQTMASSVATPLETQFGQIPGLTQMTSASALGFTQITLQFDLSRAIDGAVSDTLSAINAASAQLPPNLPYPPTIRKVNPADTPILVLGITSDTLPLTTVDAYAETILLQKISQISGVGLVGIGGQQKPAIRVRVDPQALAARGIGLEDVRNVISGANVDQPKGTLKERLCRAAVSRIRGRGERGSCPFAADFAHTHSDDVRASAKAATRAAWAPLSSLRARLRRPAQPL